MQYSIEKQKSRSIYNGESVYVLYLILLCAMFFIRDVFEVGVPLFIFLGYFAVGYVVFDYDHALALTAMLPLLNHGTQTNYIVLIAIVMYLIKYGRKMVITSPLIIVVFLMLFELFHVALAEDSYSEYLRYVIQYVYIGLILGERRIKTLLKKPIIVVKTFIFMAAYFMLDVLLVTLKYFTLPQMLESDFRFGSLTEIIGDKPALTDNQNMVALFSMVAICLIVVCMIHEKKHYVINTLGIIYFSFFGFMTASKTFVVCMLALAILVILFISRESMGKTVFLLLIGAVLVVILANTVLSDVFNKVIERFEAEDISTGRTTLLRLYNEYLLSDWKNLLFGIGLQEVDVKCDMPKAPHNAIQEVIVCWGLIGLLAVAAICWQLYKQYRTIESKERFVHILPFGLFLIFIQTIQFVRLPAIFGLLVLLYVVILLGDKNKVENELQIA